MTNRTYFRVNRARFGKSEFFLAVDGLVPIPPPGSSISISMGDENVTAEVISIRVDIAHGVKLYEQTIICNARSA